MTATPTDIPEDIRAKAFKIADGWSHDDEERDDMQADIARAILAERERCAQIAKAFHCQEEDDILEPEYATGRNVTAQFIVAQILIPNSARGFSSAEQAGEVGPPPTTSPAANSPVPAQDSLGTAFGESPCGKSEAAHRASERTLADAGLNDGAPAGQTGNEVVTAGETAPNSTGAA